MLQIYGLLLRARYRPNIEHCGQLLTFSLSPPLLPPPSHLLFPSFSLLLLPSPPLFRQVTQCVEYFSARDTLRD
jgi:hypothetical protein